jgi:hypothetical protein
MTLSVPEMIRTLSFPNVSLSQRDYHARVAYIPAPAATVYYLSVAHARISHRRHCQGSVNDRPSPLNRSRAASDVVPGDNREPVTSGSLPSAWGGVVLVLPNVV